MMLLKLNMSVKMERQKVLKENLKLLKDEVIDTAVMNVKELRKFYAEQIEAAKKDNVLLSLHLKSYNDENIRPDNVWSCCFCLLQRCS